MKPKYSRRRKNKHVVRADADFIDVPPRRPGRRSGRARERVVFMKYTPLRPPYTNVRKFWPTLMATRPVYGQRRAKGK